MKRDMNHCYYCARPVPLGGNPPRCNDRTECPSYRLPDGSQPEREPVKYSPTEPSPPVEYGASQYAVWAAG